jgi:DNA-3-methyladenine glycosylase II
MPLQNKDTKKVLAYFKKVDPIIFAVMKDIDFNDWFKPQEKIGTPRVYFKALCHEIIGQQLSGSVAKVIPQRFRALFPRGTVSAQAVLLLKDEELRNVGMSWSKVSFIKDLASKVVNKEIHFAKIPTMSDKEVTAELTSVKGIGPWTSEMFLIFTLGRENVFSYGDLGLNKALSRLYNKKNLSPKQKARIVEKWSPYKSYGSIALWHSLDAA